MFKRPLRTGPLVIATLMLFAATTAQAAEWRFDGVYAGGEVGLGRFSIGAKQSIGGLGDDDLFYGGVIGFRRQFGDRLVLGGEARAGDSRASDRFQGIIVAAPGTFVSARLGRSLGVDALAGIALGPTRETLLFVSGGYINTRLGGSMLPEAIGAEINRPFAADKGGYRIGGGLETHLWRRLSFRVGAHFAHTGPVDQTQILGGLIYRF